ncbi:MAG: hemerythrin domain-containing protein [Methanospirillum sp.]
MRTLQAPEPLVHEHQEFRDQLFDAVESGGELAVVARELIEMLTPHFRIEEETAFPPLTLMVPLSRGEIAPGMNSRN